MNNISVYTDKSNVAETVTKIPTKINEFFDMLITKASELLNAPTSSEIMNIDWSNIASIIGTISIFLVLAIIFVITLYFLRSIGLYEMAKQKNIKYAWLAFIPFGCLYIYGAILKKTNIFGIEIDNAGFLLPALLISSWLPYVGCFSSILFIIAKIALLYRLYQEKVPNFATVLIILSIFIPVLIPIIIFAIRKK